MRVNRLYLLLGALLAFGAAADEAVSSDFLEFLGNGSQQGDQWIDPMSLHESPEVFAAMPSAKNDAKQGNVPTRRNNVSPPKDTSTPRNGDGGKKDD